MSLYRWVCDDKRPAGGIVLPGFARFSPGLGIFPIRYGAGYVTGEFSGRAKGFPVQKRALFLRATA